MADNVAITAGAGTTIRTIDIGGGVEVQAVALMDGSGNLVGSTVGNNGRGGNVVVLNDVPVVGLDVSGAVMQTANQPVYIGGRVRLGTAISALEADGDAMGAVFTGDGKQIVALGAPEDEGPTTPIVAGGDTNAHAFIAAQSSSPAPGVKIALGGITVLNLSASSVGIIFFDGATEIGRAGIPAAPGGVITFNTPLKTTAAVAMNYQLVQIGAIAVPAASTVYITPHWRKVRA